MAGSRTGPRSPSRTSASSAPRTTGGDRVKGADVPGRLGGKVAIVTGGGSGIGRAAAIRFAGEGACVLVADIAAGGAGAVAGEIAGGGGRAAAMAVDVSDPAQTAAMAARAVAEFGGIDILMTAAGVLSFGSVTETDPQAWNRVIGINLTGTFLAARAVILASDDASYVTGAVFAVDGGQTAKVGMTLADLGTIARQA